MAVGNEVAMNLPGIFACGGEQPSPRDRRLTFEKAVEYVLSKEEAA
jgi:hypothetical protein